MLVLDTSALLFWTLDHHQLSLKAYRSIEQADRLIISSISVWEIALKVKRGKLELPLSISDYIERLDRLERLEIFSVDVRTWLDNLRLDWDHRDPADRIIVAIARRLDCLLATSDRVIADFYPSIV